MTLDSVNSQILAKRTESFEKLQGPRVGDYLQTESGYLRFTHDWGDCIQVTCPRFGNGSFYLSDFGASYSGCLDPAISKSKLIDTGRIRPGRFWFFNHDMARAYNGIEVTVNCKVWNMKGEEDAR